MSPTREAIALPGPLPDDCPSRWIPPFRGRAARPSVADGAHPGRAAARRADACRRHLDVETAPWSPHTRGEHVWRHRARDAVRGDCAGAEPADSRHGPPARGVRDLHLLPAADDWGRTDRSHRQPAERRRAVRLAVRAALHPSRGALLEQRQHPEPRAAYAALGGDARRHHLRAERAGHRLHRIFHARSLRCRPPPAAAGVVAAGAPPRRLSGGDDALDRGDCARGRPRGLFRLPQGRSTRQGGKAADCAGGAGHAGTAGGCAAIRSRLAGAGDFDCKGQPEKQPVGPRHPERGRRRALPAGRQSRWEERRRSSTANCRETTSFA